uniref:Uncharacterized protein n=1 Tax=Anguilla anguilla TaxID=7936 RepID=A0A0E9PZ72_ANGAN
MLNTLPVGLENLAFLEDGADWLCCREDGTLVGFPLGNLPLRKPHPDLSHFIFHVF